MRNSAWLVIFLFVICLNAQENELPNPDLDSGSVHWYPATTPDSLPPGTIQEWCPDCGREGTGGLHILAPHYADRFIGFLSLIDSVYPGLKYRYAADIRYNSRGQVLFTVAFLNSSMELVGMAPPMPLYGEFEWKRLSAYGKAPPEANRMMFVFGTQEPAEAWIDNCFLGVGDTSYHNLTVDYMASGLALKNLSGTNRGPVNPRSPFDFSAGFRNLKIPIVRTHDWYGPGDRHIIFPDWEADPTLEHSYHFETTDTLIEAIVSTGAELLFRLGESWEDEPIFNVPPPNNTTWAMVCKHIAKHYNDGWEGGYCYNIKYWEIWNEPDIDWFWEGTYQQFYDMYIEVAETLKAYDPSLKIGGPAVANPANYQFVSGMLNALDSAGAPLDFFSWHRYDDGPAFNYILINRYLRQLLDEYGFEETELILNEWNLAAAIRMEYDSCYSPYNAAVASGVLALMQNENISQVMRYRTDSGIFGLWGDLGELTYSGAAYRMIAELYDNPLRLAVSEFESTAIAVLAGKADNWTSMAVLITDWGSNRKGYNLDIISLPDSIEYNWTVHALDREHFGTIIDSGAASSEILRLEIPLDPPAVHLIIVEGLPVGIGDRNILPGDFFLTAYPNPFNCTCQIRLKGIPEKTTTQVWIELYDITGRVVERLILEPGTDRVIWNAANYSSGIYLCRVNRGKQSYSKKLVLLK
ncbi:T9SS type A sorting domain-containing protein [bacterium]|nr:T9SS type A sorting domain-containing protein [bacterium]